MQQGIWTTRQMLRQAIVAALYVVLTWALPSLAYGEVQFRISEVLTLLAFYRRSYIVGLTIGCAIANIPSSLGTLDVVVGTTASFLALTAMSRCRSIWIASLMPALASVLIGLEIYYLTDSAVNFFVVTAQIMVSECVIVTGIGVPLFRFMMRRQHMRQLILEEV